MNDTQVLEQLAATDAYAPATQVPGEAWTADVTFTEIERRISMQTQRTNSPVVPPRGRRHTGWLMAAAAFAVVTIVGAVIGLTTIGGDDVEPATTVPPTTTEAPSTRTAMEIAADFIEARSNWDGAEMQALMSEGAVLEGEIVPRPSGYSSLAEFDRAVGTTYRLGECNQTDLGTHVSLSCLYTMENDWTRAMGVELPVRSGFDSGSVFTFDIAGDRIIRLEVTVTAAFFTEVLNPFADWLEEVHPDDVDVMFVVGPREPWPGNRPRLDAEALALWERNSQEFVDFINAVG